MISVVLTGLAAWMAYQVVRAVVPVPAALQPLLVIGACYGLPFALPQLTHALAAAALAAVVTRVSSRPETSAQSLAEMLIELRKRASRGRGRASRVPDLPR
ncbi:hypothetical protein ACFWYW_24110 [Nonomuraea sp. NPDC059023]|uniref:hypothetical protein n=1 Tax=unclassified Nonomuraea TaxID=2593643 RepID=UPI0036778830